MSERRPATHGGELIDDPAPVTDRPDGRGAGVDSVQMSTARPQRLGQPSPQGTARAPRAAPRPGRRLLRRRAIIRQIDPWSVLKLSLIFYFCVLLVVMLGLTVFWAVINRLGVVTTVLGFLSDLQLNVTINAGNIARAIFLVGLLNVVLWSGINVFLAFLYNLVADLLGGLKVTLAEEE